MPAKRAKSGNKKPRPTRGGGHQPSGRRPQGATRPRRAPRTSTGSSSLAPAAISTSRRMAVSYSSLSASSMSGLRVVCTVPICEIGNDSKFNNGLFVQGAGTSSASFSTVANMLPYEMSAVAGITGGPPIPGNLGMKASYISPHLPLLALAFDRYKMNSLTFHYEPQSTSTVSDRLVFAWTDDPNHPFLSASASYNGVVPTQLQALVTPDSVAFMPWKQWSLKVPVSREPHFLYDQGNTIGTGGETDTSRLYSFGAMTCVASAVGGDPIQYGVLYATISIDLIDPVPIVKSISTLVASMHDLRKRPSPLPLLKKSSPIDLPVESKVVREPDDDIENLESPTPPRYVPAPSTGLGTAGWFGGASPATPTPVKKTSIK